MKSNKIFIALAAMAALIPAGLSAQAPKPADPDLQFTTIVENPITSIKNQNNSGTCWCFSTIAYLESEIIRQNKIKDPANYPDFSEMFVVSHSYQDRAYKYICLDGNLTFGPGSQSEDVLDVIREYGIVPQSVMPGLNYGTTLPVHGELDATAEAYVKAIAQNPNKKLSTAWRNGFKGIMDAYLGECPETFTYEGKEYTPKSYWDTFNINLDDYVSLTSFSHHPFYTKFAVEVADNWRWDESYNVPIDVFMDVLKSAIENGYTVAWGTDCSEKGFTRNGLGLLLEETKKASGSDQERWTGKAEDKDAEAKPEAPKEIDPDQAYRQQGWDDKTLTDDHGMQIYGIAKDQYGNLYYMVKNSWGESGKYKGIWYCSEKFVKGKSLDYMVHKSALPKDLRKKLGID